MYGTVARTKVKPENRDKLREVVTRQMSARTVEGFVTSYLLFENEGDDAWLIAVFSDRASYDKNADDPQMDAEYQEFRALMEADPEWHDGEIESLGR